MHLAIKHSYLVCDQDCAKKPFSFENAVALFLGHPVHLDIDLAQLASVQSRFLSTRQEDDLWTRSKAAKEVQLGHPSS